VDHYQAAITLGVSTADVHNDFGAALAQVGRFREAEVAFREALSRRPGDPGIAANLARVRELIKSGRGAGRN
jgi:Flp pilus assembly protein TadD